MKRVYEHRKGSMPGFTQRYRCKRLVWFETFDTMLEAIQREKAIKRYARDWKLNLVERENPAWNDLYEGLLGNHGSSGQTRG